jgi:hypothetical protein
MTRSPLLLTLLIADYGTIIKHSGLIYAIFSLTSPGMNLLSGLRIPLSVHLCYLM